MAEPAKKIFFNYSSSEKDTVMLTNLCLHFAVLRDKVSLWHKGKLIPGDDIKVTMEKNLDDSNAAVHLLSINYETEADCTDIMQRSISLHKKNVPVLISYFDWESDDTLTQLKEALLPHDHEPVDAHPNFDKVYTEIVQSVKNDLFNDSTRISFNQRGYYYLLAGIALVAGICTSVWVNNEFDSILVTLLVFAMFLITSLFILRKIFFPVSVSTNKS